MCLQPILNVMAVVEVLDGILVPVFCEVHLSCANSENGLSEHSFYRWGTVGERAWTGLAVLLSFPPPLPGTGREAMAIGLHVFFKGHGFGRVQMQG